MLYTEPKPVIFDVGEKNDKNSLQIKSHYFPRRSALPFDKFWFISDHLKDVSLKTFTAKANSDSCRILWSYKRSKGVTYIKG